MRKKGSGCSTEALVALRNGIETWRRTRTTRRRMPERLWKRAVILARRHGICAVSRAVGVDYKALRLRMEALSDRDAPRKPVAFVEAPAFFSRPAGAFGEVVIELTEVDGRKMVLRFPESFPFDMREAVSRFRRRE